MTKSLKALNVGEVMGLILVSNHVIAKDIRVLPTAAMSYLDINSMSRGFTPKQAQHC